MEAPKRTRDCEGGRATKAHILKNFVPDFIKSYQKYNIRKFVSQKNLRSPRTLDNNLKVNFGKMIFFQYDEKKNVNLISDTTTIKYLPAGKKVLISIIDPGINNVTVQTHGIF